MKRILLCVLTVVVLVVSILNFANVQSPIGVVNAVDGAGAEIQLVKTVNATNIISGDDVQYTLQVTNIGNQTLYNVTVVDDTLDFVLDPISFSPLLGPGQSNLTLINVTIVGVGILTNIANATGTTIDGYNVTDGDSVSVIIGLGQQVESCDSSGVKKDTFIVGDDMYVNGTGFGNSTTYNLYVVEDQVWSYNMTIPSRVPGTATTVTSAPDGTIPPTLVWANPLTPGKYDIIVDVNNNTRYDAFDALDDNDVEVTAGFFVIPEVAIGSVMAIASMFTAFGLYAYKKKRNQQNK